MEQHELELAVAHEHLVAALAAEQHFQACPVRGREDEVLPDDAQPGERRILRFERMPEAGSAIGGIGPGVVDVDPRALRHARDERPLA